VSQAARAAPEPSAHEVEPLVGAGAEFRGTLSFRGAARIEGRVSGAVSATGTLLVGAGAVVAADIEVDELIVAGEVEGHVRARVRVELKPGARLRGSVETPRLAVAEGSILDGRCRAGASPD
jgi:cytoskeletal protein CcmA (bactofilin family)